MKTCRLFSGIGRLLLASFAVTLGLGNNLLAQTATNLLVLNTIRQSTNSVAGGTNSAALGFASRATAPYSLAEGSNTLASGKAAHAEGMLSAATGVASHAEGNASTATAFAAHAEGFYSFAGAQGSHAEGCWTRAIGLNSHAGGYLTIAEGAQAHAAGLGTIASAQNSHAGGAYSQVLSNHTNAFIHASGTGTNNMRQTQFQDTAHFERLMTFSPANDASNSVLARWENDARYVNATGDTVTGTLYVEGGIQLAEGAWVSGDGLNGGPFPGLLEWETTTLRMGPTNLEYGVLLSGNELSFYGGGPGNLTWSNQVRASLRDRRLYGTWTADALVGDGAGLTNFNPEHVRAWSLVNTEEPYLDSLRHDAAGDGWMIANPNNFLSAGLDLIEGDDMEPDYLQIKPKWLSNAVLRAGGTMTGPLVVSASENQTNLLVAGWAKLSYIPPQGGLSMGTFTNGLPQ